MMLKQNKKLAKLKQCLCLVTLMFVPLKPSVFKNNSETKGSWWTSIVSLGVYGKGGV